MIPCPRCGNKHMDRTQDGDLDCWNCGNVVYLKEPSANTPNMREPRPGSSSSNVRRGSVAVQG